MSQRSLRASTSSPSVGSSRKRISGSLIRAMAMLRRLCQPPDSLPAFLPRTSVRSNRSVSSSSFRCRFSLEKPWTPHISVRFSFTVRPGATAVSCGDTPMMFLTSAASLAILLPSRKASPPVGFVRQESILIVVVFPAPLTPSRENSSPRSTLRSRPSTAVRFLYFFVSPTVLMASIPVPPHIHSVSLHAEQDSLRLHASAPFPAAETAFSENRCFSPR